MFTSVNVAILILTFHHVQATGHHSFCVTGSILSSQINGKYEFKDTNANGFIYYNTNLNLYLFPYIESDDFKQYLIGPDPSIHSAHSFSTIQASSPYIFNPEDFITNWQSYIFTNTTDIPQLQNDELMRLISCASMCADSILYDWISYNTSIETSVYYNATNNQYLYRSNIGTYNEQWQTYNTDNALYTTLPIQNLNIGTCMSTNMSTKMASIPSYITQNVSVKQNQDKYGVMATLFAATSAIFVLFIFMAVLIKKYVLDPEEKGKCHNCLQQSKNVNKADKPSDKSDTNRVQITKSVKSGKNIQRRSPKTTLSVNWGYAFSSDDDMSTGNAPIRKMTNSVLSNSPRSIRSNSKSKYADILPPSRPPPIGMRPVLTAKQLSIRPLPVTPTERKTEEMDFEHETFVPPSPQNKQEIEKYVHWKAKRNNCTDQKEIDARIKKREKMFALLAAPNKQNKIVD